MRDSDEYALLDCGSGRRLEAFGSLLVDRPAPGATQPPRAPERWAGAVSYHRGSGWWGPHGTPPAEEGQPVAIAGVTMELRFTPSGQVGLFPEHAANAAWVSTAVGSRASASDAGDGPPEVLNLFAYTGLATLVAAGAGGRVTHVDASRPSVLWARHNADLSGLAEGPIRWIVDEVLTFVQREARRGRRYAGLILDPPSYGHGTRGGAGVWRFDERIGELLDACGDIAAPDAFWLLTTHSPGWDPTRLVTILRAAAGTPAQHVEGVPLELVAESGAVLRLGSAARFDPLAMNRR